VSRAGTFVAKEFREVAPAAILFLFLFHMIALTRAVAVDDYSISALRATSATIGALIVAKAVLIVEALPMARLFSRSPAVHILWKTLLFGVVALLFKFVEEIIPLALKHGGLASATETLLRETSWPVFWLLALWSLGGLLLYCLASELVRALGREKVKEMLFGSGGKR